MLNNDFLRIRDIWKPSTYTKKWSVLVMGPVLTVFVGLIYAQALAEWILAKTKGMRRR